MTIVRIDWLVIRKNQKLISVCVKTLSTLVLLYVLTLDVV